MGERREGDGCSIFWYGDRGRPGGRMILWWRWRRQAKTTMREAGHRTAGGEGGAGPISKLRNNMIRSLGLEWSMSEVGTPPHHDSEKPHGQVASIKNNNNNHRCCRSYKRAIICFNDVFRKF